MKLNQLHENTDSIWLLEEAFNNTFKDQTLEEAWFSFDDHEKDLVSRTWTAIKTRNIGVLWGGDESDLKSRGGLLKIDKFIESELAQDFGFAVKLLSRIVIMVAVVAAMTAAIAMGVLMWLAIAGTMVNWFVISIAYGWWLGALLTGLGMTLNFKWLESRPSLAFSNEQLEKIVGYLIEQFNQTADSWPKMKEILLKRLTRTASKIKGISSFMGKNDERTPSVGATPL